MTHPGSLDPDLLRTFVCIAEAGTFTRAAEIIGRSQSAVSMQVRRLETLLGQPLLARSKGGAVRLTGHGSRLLARAKEMLALNDAIWADFHGNDGSGQPFPNDYALPLKAQREAFTTQVMLTLLTNEKFSEAYAMVMRRVETKRPIQPARLDPREDELYMALLSMLEYISINFLSNTMDRDIILRQRKTGLLRVYEVLGGYIDYKREVWQRPHAYRSFEMVVREYILGDMGDAVSGGVAPFVVSANAAD
jgi:molybdate transport repressor ModE-like protein